MTHPLALRTPWYVLERASTPVPVTDPLAQRPAIQKYDSPEFVRQLLADPRESLKFHPQEDAWSFPVPVGAFPIAGATGRARFATSRLVHTSMRKLYQPSHDRFYAVAVELFCDEPGLPRPGDVRGVELRFILRRERIVVSDVKAARTLARDLALDLDAARCTADAPVPETDDVQDVLWVERTEGREFTPDQANRLASIAPKRIVEAWTVNTAGRSHWTSVDDDALPELAPDEREFPMWRLPPRDGDCSAAQTRSLWFGMVPTSSGELDDTGQQMLDDRSIYRIRCFARQQREGCPPRLWWSSPTAAYRLAAFYDPQGTKNRRVTITMPDFRTLAARAGQPQGPGGVEIVRPPGSQLTSGSDRGRPENESLNFGSGTSRCTFAIELLMIVAMFLFSLFLPVVVFIFQLWWLLLLRFCFPRPDLALQVLTAHFDGNGTLATLSPAGLAALDRLLESPGAAKRLRQPNSGFPRTGPGAAATAGDLVRSMDPASATTSPDRTPEPVPDDPLCKP